MHSTLNNARAHPDAPRSDRDRSVDIGELTLGLALKTVQAGPVIVLFGVWGLFAALSPYFFTQSNLTNILVQSSSVALLALGAFVVILVGKLDISLGATVGLCTIVGAIMFRDYPEWSWAVVPVVLLTGAAIGVANSFIVVALRIDNSFIITLGMLYAVRSFSYVLSGGAQVPGVAPYLADMASARILGIPGPVILVAITGVALWVLLNRVVWGRWIVAIGGSADAAEKVGIPVRLVLFSVYIIAGLFAAIAGLLVAGRNHAGTVDDGTSVLLAIAAVVIGGASLSGGRGNVWSTIVGAVILTSITNGLTLISVSPNWTPFAIGAVLIVAVCLDKLRSGIEGGLRLQQARIQAKV
ncbi:ABC transporter permease [Pelagibacterium sp.]|uniref:ABC transporter permease n=1 Tax=Pelagibacterium sp. TaxID=1967288 RepID=UPI003BA84EE4